MSNPCFYSRFFCYVHDNPSSAALTVTTSLSARTPSFWRSRECLPAMNHVCIQQTAKLHATPTNALSLDTPPNAAGRNSRHVTPPPRKQPPLSSTPPTAAEHKRQETESAGPPVPCVAQTQTHVLPPRGTAPTSGAGEVSRRYSRVAAWAESWPVFAAPSIQPHGEALD